MGPLVFQSGLFDAETIARNTEMKAPEIGSDIVVLVFGVSFSEKNGCKGSERL